MYPSVARTTVAARIPPRSVSHRPGAMARDLGPFVDGAPPAARPPRPAPGPGGPDRPPRSGGCRCRRGRRSPRPWPRPRSPTATGGRPRPTPRSTGAGGHLVAGALQLGRCAGHHHRPARGEVALDRSDPTTRPTSSDGGLHGPAHGRTGPGSAHLVQPLLGGGEQRRAPPAVAAGRPEADHVPLDDGDAQARDRLSQVVGGPQAGEPATRPRRRPPRGRRGAAAGCRSARAAGPTTVRGAGSARPPRLRSASTPRSGPNAGWRSSPRTPPPRR